MLSTDAFKVSWLYQEGFVEGKAKGKAEGIAEGRAEGIAEGKTEGVADAIRVVVSMRFPTLWPIPELLQVRPEALDNLLLSIFKAQVPEEARSAIKAAAAVTRPS